MLPNWNHYANSTDLCCRSKCAAWLCSIHHYQFQWSLPYLLVSLLECEEHTVCWQTWNGDLWCWKMLLSVEGLAADHTGLTRCCSGWTWETVVTTGQVAGTWHCELTIWCLSAGCRTPAETHTTLPVIINQSINQSIKSMTTTTTVVLNQGLVTWSLFMTGRRALYTKHTLRPKRISCPEAMGDFTVCHNFKSQT